MYCKYCGKKLEENEICTCPGARAEAAAAGHAGATSPSDSGPAAPVGAVPRTLLFKVGGGIVALLILVALLAFVLVNRTATLDLKNYVQVAFDGMNTKGTAQVSVDWSALEQGIQDKGRGNFNDVLLLETSIQADADATEDLSNGDTVTVQIGYDESAADRMKLKLVNTTLNFQVSDLVDGTPADAFADLEMSYEGIAPYGTAVATNNSQDDFVKTISYSIEPSSGLSNGDTVTVTALYNEYNAQDQLRYLPETTKTYTVEGLDEYVQSYDQLDEDTLDAVTQQSKDVINTELLSSNYTYAEAAYDSYFGNHYERDSIVLKEVSLLNSYFAVSKPDATSNYSNNLLIQVFQVTATDNTNSDGVTFYYAVEYADFLKTAEGEIQVSLTASDSYGRPTTDGIYNKMVAPLTSTYTVTQS